ncbi:MAG: segregation/condensation protein A [Nanobdellota archaeon]
MADEDSLLTTLMDENDITWQSMIHELVRNEEMDPWDVNLGTLAEKFIKMIHEIKETNLKVGGKVILASAILLRLKSGKFIDTDLAELEKLMTEDSDIEEFEEFEENELQQVLEEKKKKDYKIYPRTPLPRQRKVSVYDLIGALENILETKSVNKSRKPQKNNKKTEVKLDEEDIQFAIQTVFKEVSTKCRSDKDNKVKFSKILPSDRKEDIISTFVPLLHLTNQRVTDLHQEEAFSDFDIELLKRSL